jgi:hypothetical protein
MIKIERLAAGVLPISSGIRLVNGQMCWCEHIRPANGNQGSDALINKKENIVTK